jgi:voltage-gated potassium channel
VRNWKQTVKLNLTYALKLFVSFLPMLSFCGFVYILGSLLIWNFYQAGGNGLSESMYYMYFLMLAEPTFPVTPKHWVVEALGMIAPLVGIMVVFDLLARFSLHVFSKKTNQREWVNVVASTYKNHIVLCGLGKVGSKVFEELSALGEEIVCIESNVDACGVRIARESGHPVLIDDAKDDKVLLQAGIERAKAVLAVTDQDMVNLEIVLDSRKFNSKIRAIARIFEPELGKKINAAFQLDGVYSTSTVAAPFFAAASLDPEIISSYYVEERRFVVVQTTVRKGDWLDGITVKGAFDKHGFAIATSTKNGDSAHRLKSDSVVTLGHKISFQCSYSDFKKYRKQCPIT